MLTLILISFVALFTFSCGEHLSEKTTITFWAMGTEGEFIEKLIPDFEQKNPDIHVDVQAIPWSLAHEKVLTAYAGGAHPDVCQLGNTWIPEFQAIGAIMPLDSMIAQSAQVQPDSFFQGIWDTNVLGEKVWGIPWYVDTRVLFYRSDILKKIGYDGPPKTWQQWLRVSRKIKQEAPARYAVFFSLLFNDFQAPIIFVMNNGGKFLKDNDCYGAFDHPATVEALRFYLTFFEEGLASRSTTEFANIYQGFTDGDFAMVVTGPWDVGQMRRRSPEINGKWTTAVIPRNKYGYSTAGGASLIMFKDTRHPEAAWKLIEFLSDPETQIQFFRMTRDLPAVRSAWTAAEIKNDPEIAAFRAQLDSVKATPKIAEWEQIAVKMQEHLYRVIFGQVTLEKAIEQLNRDVNRILEKRRWLLSKGLLLTEK